MPEIGTGWTSRLIAGIAELLDATGVGAWHPDGTPYAAGETGILDRAIPPEPDRIITLAAYPIDSAEHVGMADHDCAVQVRVRGLPYDMRDCDDLADAVYDELDGLHDVVLGGIPIVLMWRQSYTSLGQDGSDRWERSENYYVRAMRPTRYNTD